MAETASIPQEFRPQEGPQTAFLTSRADIAIYGGAAGGGKSWALLFEPLRHCKVARFGAVIFRRISKQVTNEGGLWDEAGGLYPLVGATARVGDLEYRWPSGAKVTFAHLQHEATKYGWQGAQVPMIGFDELTHFTESQFFYMLSRNRTTCGVKPYVRGTTNPDAGSWVKTFLGPWVDRKHPLFPTASGTILFMLRVDGKIEYYRTREECAEENPGKRPKSVTFIKASIFDNKKLLEKDPDYLANLEAQGTVEKARLLDGDWDIVNEGLVYPGLFGCIVEDEDWPDDATTAGWRQVGGIDWGFRDPLSAVLAWEDPDGTLWIHWEYYESRKTLAEFSKVLHDATARSPRYHADPAGATQIAEVRLGGHDVIPCVHLGTKPIKSGVAIVTERINAGSLKIHASLFNLIAEAGKYCYPERGRGDTEAPVDRDNHLMDALRYMVVGNDRGEVVPDGTAPESDEEKAARAEAERLEREQAEAEHFDPDNDHWWDR